MIEHLPVMKSLLRGSLHVTTQQAVFALFLTKSKQSRRVPGQYASFLVGKQLTDRNVVIREDWTICRLISCINEMIFDVFKSIFSLGSAMRGQTRAEKQL